MLAPNVVSSIVDSQNTMPEDLVVLDAETSELATRERLALASRQDAREYVRTKVIPKILET